MASVNFVIIIGNIGRAPETRYMPDGTAVTVFQVATTEKYRDRNTGQPKESTEWHKIVTHRQLAETARDTFQKGGQVYVEGRLQTRKWTDKAGVERYTTEIIASAAKLLGGDQGNAPGAAGSTSPKSPGRGAGSRPSSARSDNSKPPAGVGGFHDDDEPPY